MSPLIAGGLSYYVAQKMGTSGSDPGEHFWRGCLFAFLFGVIRFAFVPR